MFRSLYAKLALALVGLFLVVGCVFAWVISYSMDMYQQEVSQKLHRGVAAYLVEHNELSLESEAAQAAVNELFESVMILNPNVEVYLLDTDGNIIACSAKTEDLRRRVVRLEPIERFLADGEMPIFGDDPRQEDVSKIFSAAPVRHDGALAGYVYIVTGSERYDSMMAMLRGSYILRTGVAGLLAAGVFAVLAGLVIFASLTRRLRRLTSAVAAFERDGSVDPRVLPVPDRGSADEIDRLAAIVRDMAERIASRIDDLEQADRLRRELVANVSHDLRTPLASLQGYLDTVLMKHDVLTEEEKKSYVEIAARHGRRLSTLIAELFELAYLDANDAPPECEPFSIEDLAQDVAHKFQLQTREAGVTLHVRPQPGLPLVFGNIAMIERVLENLIRNSLRHTPAGGEVRLNLSPAPEAVTVEVCDTGCGIAAADLPYIFDRFYQPHHERHNGVEGAGLGLAISRRILELHGSRIEVRSEAARGSAFTFDLRVAAKSPLPPEMRGAA